jgi:undecaprenyl diphosphate synthase
MADIPPKHLAIICDGNRRWAKAHGLEVFLGHQKAVDEVIEPLVDRAAERGVEYLTFWVFSTENWARARIEVDYLLSLFRTVFDQQVQRLHEKNVRVMTIGDTSKFDTDIQERIRNGTELTKHNTGITTIFALNYGGRDELLRAVNKLVQARSDSRSKAAATLAAGGDEAEIGSEKNMAVTTEELEKFLDTAQIPDPDLIIRTSGEQRLSGLLPWQAVYAELSFPAFNFPEFTPEKLDQILDEFASRSRRFGK